jgi:tetratricopeptide (TPR) repeat protein
MTTPLHRTLRPVPWLLCLVAAACAGPAATTASDQDLATVAQIRMELDHGEVDKAIRHGEELMRQHPDDPAIEHVLIAALSHSQDEAQRARRTEILARAASRPAKDGRGLYARASARRESGDLVGAETDLDALLQKDGPTAQALALRATVRAQRDNLQGALVDFDKAVDLAPRQASFRMQRAMLRVKMGDKTGGEADFKEVVARNPQVPWPYIQLATLYHESGRYRDALEALRQALALRPEDPALLLLEGQLLWQLDQKDTARVRFQRAVELAPGAEWAPAVRRALAEGDLRAFTQRPAGS